MQIIVTIKCKSSFTVHQCRGFPILLMKIKIKDKIKEHFSINKCMRKDALLVISGLENISNISSKLNFN